MVRMDNDFAYEPVPETARQGPLGILAVWIGFVVVIGAMATGGAVSRELPFNQLVVLILAGNLILGSFAALGGYVGAKSGKSFSLLILDAFPDFTARIVNLYVPVVLIFWYSVISDLMGGYLINGFNINPDFRLIFSLFAAIVFCISAYFGMRVLSIVSLISIPLIAILATWAVFSSELPSYEPSSSIKDFGDLNKILGLIFATWIMGAVVNLQDLTRFCRTATIGASVGFIGVVLGNSFNLILGARAALITGEFDPSQILAGIGMSVLALVLVVANLWTTSDNNMYSASLGFSRAVDARRQHAVIVLAAIACVLILFEPAQMGTIVNAIIIMGSTAPAIGAVAISRYFVGVAKEDSFRTPSWIGWMCWLVGSACAVWLTGALGIVSAFVVAFVLYRLLAMRFGSERAMAHAFDRPAV